jgi:hypothetical protein
VEAAAAKPQEDSLGCHHLSCKSSAFGHKATSSLLVEKALTTFSLLVKKPLTSGFLIKMALGSCHLEAMVLVLPQVVDPPLPSPVGIFRKGASPKKNGPPGWVRRQYPSSLFVFAKGSLMPFFVTKGTANIGQGIEFLIIVKHPVGGA